VRFKGKNIADLLDTTIEESLEFFDAHPAIRRKLATLQEVGLGYIRIGQPATTLSGMPSIDAMVCMRSSASLPRSIYAAASKSLMRWNTMPAITHSLSSKRQKIERGNRSLRDYRSQ
jgi:transposase-like protein